MDSSSEDILPPFQFDDLTLQSMIVSWEGKNYPVSLLKRNHYAAKILEDNDILTDIIEHGHHWKEEEDDLYVLFKLASLSKVVVMRSDMEKYVLEHVDEETAFVSWENGIVPHLDIRINKLNEFLIENAFYGNKGVSFSTCTFHFSPSEFKGFFKKWTKNGWPVQYLMKDHYGAKILMDNTVFELMDFYGHTWKLENGSLILPYSADINGPPADLVWQEAYPTIPIRKNPYNEYLFNGWTYRECGLVPIHMWKWEKLERAYQYPEDERPEYSYLDILSCNWESEGLQGVLFSGLGHVSIEFCDAESGYLYSVGQYMSPDTHLNIRTTPAVTVPAAFFAPDPYMSAKGEKSAHRYSLGTGKQGKANIKKIISMIENLHGYSIDEKGVITVCPGRLHNGMDYNCTDFAYLVERFAMQLCNAQLVRLDDTSLYPPGRDFAPSKLGWRKKMVDSIYNRFVMMSVDVMITALLKIPMLSKALGKGTVDEVQYPENSQFILQYHDELSDSDVEEIENFVASSPRGEKNPSLKYMSFPRRVRVDQLYGKRLSEYSARTLTY